MLFLRSVLSLVAAVLLAYGLPWVLERVLVQSLAGQPLTTAEAYYAIRNTGWVLIVRLILGFFLSILAGHMAARIAKEDAVRTVAIAASALSIMLIWEFTGGEFAWATPIWMRVALVAISGPAMVLGAHAQATAAQLRETP